MRIVVAVCSVTYTGRGDTELPRATRAIIIKNDGSVSIHSDKSNKPLNYMGPGHIHTIVTKGRQKIWNFDARKENLQVRLHKIISESSFELEVDDPGLTRDGTEHHLQAWLAANPQAIGEGYTLVGREYPTGAGPVDLLLLDAQGQPVAVEVKRVAMLGAVDQVSRYLEALSSMPNFGDVRGMIAALDVRPRTLELAYRRGFECVIIDPRWRETSDINAT